jgi:asparagine synthase (glutamine-hydrolysing)
MCGITGLLDRSLSPGEGEMRLERMLNSLIHRGPDSFGIHCQPEDGLYLGMRRLKIIDLAGGEQPIWNETRDVGVFFNGEIYNYRSLRSDLERNHHFTTRSDTEVLVHLYEEKGVKMLDSLRGMFAFCILDKRTDTLFFARDHFGQKPFYYWAQNGRFAFASELKALLVLPQVDASPDPERFLDYASWLSLPPPDTHFPNILKLGPGEYIRINFKSGEIEEPIRYWQLSLDSSTPFKSLDEAGAALDQAFGESVHRHLIADVPVGILLSGGLDSKAVATYAKLDGSKSLQTFTAGFSDEESEGAAGGLASSDLQIDHSLVSLEPSDLLDNLDRIAWHMDEPVGDPAAFALYRLCETARGKVKVLLSGEGADELFAGYGYRYAGITRTLSHSNWFRQLKMLLPRPAAPFPRLPWQRFCKRAHMTCAEEQISLRVEGFPGNILDPQGLTDGQLRRLLERQKQIADSVGKSQMDILSEIQLLDQNWQLPASLLQKADKMSMAASIELRCPFLDVEIAQVASRIPPKLRLDMRTYQGKLALRRTLEMRLIPMDNSAKKGFFIPIERWLRHDLRGELESDLFAPASRICSLLDRDLVKVAWKRFLDGEPLAMAFYALWLYERWARLLPIRTAALRAA